MSGPLVEGKGLVRRFTGAGGLFRPGPAVSAVDGVDLGVARGETLGLVGESGSGKSTLGRLLLRLIEPDAGSVRFDGIDVLRLRPRELRKLRRRFQIVFQDPYGSLNPRMRVGALVAEPLEIHGIGGSMAERKERVARLLEEVGLDRSAMDRKPAAFSGGQRQRIGIARAIACEPEFLVLDEPVSALDPPVQAQIVNLLADLKARHGIAYLFVAHDLRLVRHVADRVAVMYLGKIVERGPAADLYSTPRHPYTQALLAATPSLRPGKPAEPPFTGEPPSASDPPSGCRFHPRCPVAVEKCSREEPPLVQIGEGRDAACWRIGDTAI